MGDNITRTVKKAGSSVASYARNPIGTIKDIYGDVERTVKGAVTDAGRTIREFSADVSTDVKAEARNLAEQEIFHSNISLGRLTGADTKQTPDIDSAEAPSVSDAQEEAAAKISSRKKAMRRSRTIFTNPLSVGAKANVARTNLGAN